MGERPLLGYYRGWAVCRGSWRRPAFSDPALCGVRAGWEIACITDRTERQKVTQSQDLGSSLVVKGKHVTRETAEVQVKHDHSAAPMLNVAVARVVGSSDNAKTELSTICDDKLREKLKEPTLQLHAKFEAPAPAADGVRMSELAVISLYCRHHNITAEKSSHVPRPPFMVGASRINCKKCGNPREKNGRARGYYRGWAVCRGPLAPACVFRPRTVWGAGRLGGSLYWYYRLDRATKSYTTTQDLGSSLVVKGKHVTRETAEVQRSTRIRRDITPCRGLLLKARIGRYAQCPVA
jgi:hypothetical protein